MAKAARWPKPAGARRARPTCGQRAQDRHDGVAVDAGNGDEVGAVIVESTSGAGPPRRARWLAAKLTGVTQRCGGGEGALAQR
jgi:hypothetical protein